MPTPSSPWAAQPIIIRGSPRIDRRGGREGLPLLRLSVHSLLHPANQPRDRFSEVRRATRKSRSGPLTLIRWVDLSPAIHTGR